jgi:cell division protein FtsN
MIVLKASGAADFWVRADSFKQKDRADSLRGSLTLLNLPVEASSSEVNNQVWHLVSVGPYKKEVEAQRVVTRLRQENLQPSLVKVFDK